MRTLYREYRESRTCHATGAACGKGSQAVTGLSTADGGTIVSAVVPLMPTERNTGSRMRGSHSVSVMFRTVATVIVSRPGVALACSIAARSVRSRPNDMSHRSSFCASPRSAMRVDDGTSRPRVSRGAVHRPMAAMATTAVRISQRRRRLIS